MLTFAGLAPAFRAVPPEGVGGPAPNPSCRNRTGLVAIEGVLLPESPVQPGGSYPVGTRVRVPPGPAPESVDPG